MKYEELMNNHADKLIDQLLVHVLGEEFVEVHFDFQDEDQWSVVSMHQYEEDLEISLRLHLDKHFDLFLGYYDDEDEFHELTRILNEKEIEQIPIGLQKIMKKVVDDEQGLRFKSALIKQS
jgi:hypothetical protein